MKILVNNKFVLAVDVTESTDRWISGNAIHFKSTLPNASVFEVDALPIDFKLGNFEYDGAFSYTEKYRAELFAIELDACQKNRAAEYPPMADYLDGIVKGDDAQVQSYIDACLAVKAKYPKPE